MIFFLLAQVCCVRSAGYSAYYQVLHMPMCHMQQQQLTQLKLGWQDMFFWHDAFHRAFWHGEFWGWWFFFFHQDLLVLHVIKYCAVNMTDVQRKKKYSLALHSK